MSENLDSIYMNAHSLESAYLSAGSVVELTEKVVKGEVQSGVAIVRPPGHHGIYAYIYIYIYDGVLQY